MKNLITITAALVLMASGLCAQNKSLPVNIIHEDGEIQLEWSTASETNSGYFLVEGSGDGLSFTIIGRVKAAGYSLSLKKYAFELESHNTPAYYRITAVSMDGQRNSSEIAGVITNPGSNLLAHK